MEDEQQPSDRLIVQRVRNRIMEELSILAEGQSAVEQLDWDYILDFLDWFPDAPALGPACDVMLDNERQAVAETLALVLQYRDAAPSGSPLVTASSDWPARVAERAAEALAVLNVRGRFNEELEEDEPSGPAQRQ